MTRTDGNLEFMCHSADRSLEWGLGVHSRLANTFLDTARYQKTEVVS